MPIKFIHKLSETLSGGGLVLLADDSDSAGKAVLVARAESISADTVNSMLSLGGGHIRVALSPERREAFLIPRMARKQEQLPLAERDLVSVEAREGVTTGISSADRAKTISVLGAKSPNPRQLVRPGHIFPVEAREGGVLVAHSLAEGALDLVRIANLTDCAVFSEVLGEDGDFLDTKNHRDFAEKEGLLYLTLSDLVQHRLETESLVEQVTEAKLPTELGGELKSFIYRSRIHSGEHLALVKGRIDPDSPTLTRVQTEFTLSDVFGGNTPPTRKHLQAALKQIGQQQENAVFLYLRRPEGESLSKQVKNWEAEYRRKPASTMREYGLGAQILRDLGVRKIDLLSNSSKDLVGLKTFGIEIVSQRRITEAISETPKGAPVQ